MECWHNQYPADTNETCHFDMDTLRSTLKDAAMKYCLPYAAPRKAGCPKNNKRMKSPLEWKKKRKSSGSTREAMVDDNEGEEEEEGDTAPACYPKRARSRSQLWMGIFLVMLINNIYWYLVMQMKLAIFWWCYWIAGMWWCKSIGLFWWQVSLNNSLKSC